MLTSRLFAGDELLARIADGTTDRISPSRNQTTPSVAKVQQALLRWRTDALPAQGATGEYGSETAAAVKRFKSEELGLPMQEILDDVGPRTVVRLDQIAASSEPEPDDPGFAVIGREGGSPAELATVRDVIARAGGEVMLGLGARAAVVSGGQPVLDAVAPLLGGSLIGVVAPTAPQLPPGLDEDTTRSVTTWLATLDPTVLDLKNGHRAEGSFSLLDGCVVDTGDVPVGGTGPGPTDPAAAAAQARFVRLLLADLAPPGTVATPGTPTMLASVAPPADPVRRELTPPIYGGAATGTSAVPDTGWIHTLNAEVRRRVAAALGTRYVQVEQEDLMALAWRQAGPIREANRLVAAAEAAAVAGTRVREKHLEPLADAERTSVAAPMADRTVVRPTTTATTAHTAAAPAVPAPLTLATVVRRSPLPNGAGSTGWRRLSRRQGGLARRVGRSVPTPRLPVVRAATGGSPDPSVLAQGLEGHEVLPPATDWLTRPVPPPPHVALTSPTTAAASSGPSVTAGPTLAALLEGQPELVAQRLDTTDLRELPLGRPARLRQPVVPPEDVAAPPPEVLHLTAAVSVTSSPTPTAPPLSTWKSQVLPVSDPMAIQRRRLATVLAVDPRTRGPALGTDPPPTDPSGSGAAPDPVVVKLAAVTDPAGPADDHPADDHPADPDRLLRPLLAHPSFAMPIAREIVQRWPDWLMPGVTQFPMNRVDLLQTNPPFVEALLVGANQEMNRELLWREFPTDERGTSLQRFWPHAAADDTDIGEIATWTPDGALGRHRPGDATGASQLALFIRGDVLRRYPGTIVLAAPRSQQGSMTPTGDEQQWIRPFVLRIDEQTAVYGFDGLTPEKAFATPGSDVLFIIREPKRRTQFGLDLPFVPSPDDPNGPDRDVPADLPWCNEDWSDVAKNLSPKGLIGLGPEPQAHPTTAGIADAPVWPSPKPTPGQDRGDAADMARILFQRPFELIIPARRFRSVPSQ